MQRVVGVVRRRTRSRFIDSIALSIPRTTEVMFPVTCSRIPHQPKGTTNALVEERRTDRIVTAVSTRLATASIRDESRSKLRASFFFRIAFAAYIRAPSVLPCWSAYWVRRSQLGTMRQLANERRGWEYLLELVLLRFLVLEGPGGLLVERLSCELGYVSHTLAHGLWKTYFELE